MAWFKADDSFHSSKPVMKIPRRYRLQAVGLWIMAGTWSAQEESDGFIPEYVVDELCGTSAVASHLARAGLWVYVTDESQEGSSIPDRSSAVSGTPGWQFVNWSKYQPTREQLEENREKERVRKANYRASQQRPNGTDAGQTEGHHRVSEHPDPTRPDPTLKEEPKGSSKPLKRGTRIPNDFHVTDQMTAWGRENCPNIDGQRETTKFINYWKSKPGRAASKLDWESTWRNWMLNAAERAPQQKTGTRDRMLNVVALAERYSSDQLEIGK